ncbi:MAG: VCBS repeat-containing protein, partial [Thermoplasmata archaeon]
MGARNAAKRYACVLVTLVLSCSLLNIPAGGGRVEEFSGGLSSMELSFPPGGGEHTVYVKLPVWSYAIGTSLTIRGDKIPNEKYLFHTTDADFGTGQLVNATTGLDSIQRATHVTTLLPMRAYSAGRAPHYVAVGDVNGDGKNDVVVTNYYSNSTGVFLQSAGGSLASMLSLDVGAFPNGVAIADINGDGRKDIAVAAVRLDGTGYVAIFNQTGAGGLGSRDELPAGPFPDGCAIGDVSGDGAPDIVVAHWAGGSIGVFLQRPGGGFYTMVPYNVGTGPRGVAIGDVNGDGRNDIVVAVSNDNKTAVFYQAQDGQLQLPPLLLDAGHLPVGVALGDLDANGKTDIVVACSRSNETGVYFQKPDGTLQAMVRCAGTGAQPWMVATGDLNGDGRTDYAVSNYATGANVVDVLAQDILNVLRPLQNLATGASPDGVAIGDVTGDGLDDVVVANRVADTIGVFEQQPFRGEYVSTAAVVQYNIVSARAVWAERPAGEPVRVSLSNDNGEHWTPAVNGSELIFASSGTKLRYKVEFASATALTEILVNYTLETLYPSDLRLDVGADGELEWERPGLLSEAVQLPDLSEAISRYVAAHFLDI